MEKMAAGKSSACTVDTQAVSQILPTVHTRYGTLHSKSTALAVNYTCFVTVLQLMHFLFLLSHVSGV